MGQNGSTHHEPLDRVANRSQRQRRSLRLPKGERQSGPSSSPKRMDRLRRSFRDSFRRRKEHIPESTKPHQWQADEAGVKAGTCTFHVKYLGCVEVFESRGMQVCEEALKVLRNSRRRPVKAILYVSGDGLRVVEDETKGLIVDQTIEKVSFCAPDRNHEKGFSYICRDGTTRRWMCHGFFALKETGERLSHAVGCAFAACLERKQRRDKECGVTMTFDPKNSTFTRSGSFRQPSITDRLYDVEPPPVKSVSNPFAIERPHATVSMMERQGSFRGFQQLNQASPFKRQMSLRIGDLPSTLERQRSQSLEGSDFRLPPANLKPPVSPIPEASPGNDKSDSVSVMCQQLAQGLSLLSHRDDDSAAPPANSVLEMDAVTLNMGSTLDNCSDPAASTATETNSWTDIVTKPWGGAGPALPPRPAPSPQRLPTLPPAVADNVTTTSESGALPGAEQWLGRVTNVVGLRRPPPLGQHARAFSLGSGESYMRPHNANGDPFDAEWAAIAARNEQANANTNPFVTSSPVM